MLHVISERQRFRNAVLYLCHALSSHRQLSQDGHERAVVAVVLAVGRRCGGHYLKGDLLALPAGGEEVRHLRGVARA